MDREQYLSELASWAQANHADLIEAADWVGIAAAANARPTMVGVSVEPRRWSLAEIFEALKDADPVGVAAMAATYGPLLPMMNQALEANDRRSMANYAALIGAQLNATAQQAIGAMLQETVEMSVESLGRSLASIRGWPTVRAADVREAIRVAG